MFVASAFSWGQFTGPQLERPIELALVNAPLSGLAAMVKQTPDELLAKLAAHGVNAAAYQSIGELARSGNADENWLLGLIFGVDD